jgi:hypothetical protein
MNCALISESVNRIALTRSSALRPDIVIHLNVKLPVQNMFRRVAAAPRLLYREWPFHVCLLYRMYLYTDVVRYLNGNTVSFVVRTDA